MKVVNRLGQRGYLEILRGKEGGIRLAREPGEINVVAVVRDMEEELACSAACKPDRGVLRLKTHELVKPRPALARLIVFDAASIPRSSIHSRRRAAGES